MTQEILLRDICCRLPYGLWLEQKLKNCNFSTKCMLNADNIYLIERGQYDFCKPYLFPLSSMTEEIKNEIYEATGVYDIDVDSLVHIEVGTTFEDLTKIFHILNKHHIDYNGLIPMGLALDATDLNIY